MGDGFLEFTRTEVLIAANVESVWECLIEKTGAMFMGAKFTTDWKVGQPIVFEGEWEGKPYRDHGVIDSFEERRQIGFTQFSSMSGKADIPENYDLVVITLTNEGQSTVAKMTLAKPEGVEAPKGAERDQLKGNLDAILGTLKELAEG